MAPMNPAVAQPAAPVNYGLQNLAYIDPSNFEQLKSSYFQPVE